MIKSGAHSKQNFFIKSELSQGYSTVKVLHHFKTCKPKINKIDNNKRQIYLYMSMQSDQENGNASSEYQNR